MIRTITARNVNHAFTAGWYALKVNAVAEDSRNGPVLVMPTPVVTEYQKPEQRVLFHPRRDCNHFFHLMESLWMLAGENDVTWLSQFSKNISNYADAGRMHGAYGFRWRNHFDVDQIRVVIKELRANPGSRRVVMGMWDPNVDLGQSFKDHPCNTHLYFRMHGGRLDMTVCNRSNDMLWGAYGANAVHFSILQEFIARAVNAQVGVYYQISNNFHVYTEVPGVKDFLETPPDVIDHYGDMISTSPYPLFTTAERWEDFLDDCESFIQDATVGQLKTHFMKWVAVPMRDYYLGRKAGAPDASILKHMPECDWKLAATQWIERRTK